MYKMIVADLDETLISTDRTITKKNIEAIKRAIEAGVKFVPATGRGYNSVHETLKTLGLYDKEQQYTISYNGGAITENKGEKLLYFQGITFEEAEALYKFALPYEDICIHVYTPDQVWVYRFFPEEVEYLACRQPCTEIFDDNIDFLKGKEIVKAIFMNTDFDYLKQIEAKITHLTKDMDVSYSSNRYMELNRKGVNKGAGLQRLCDIIGIDISETIAIGDNFNDLSMIKAAGLGVGVANTVEAMKPECDYITENDCDHDAIAEVIEKFIFNER
ncbi:MAG: Cof-type HAD-IIB family hydrolase [Solobacterium sp.]|nr:Cof-type HAD-IIB family hydrolase [Solobacterium sp.]